ncbi:MAG: hypothetical protein WC812_04660 [Candidatus Pacearchaeota archaeon]|jgi:hypothetical protein
MKNKRGYLEISFGMIFTIILIIAFIAFAFYAIQKFIFFQKDSQYRLFLEDFKSDVDKMWKTTSGSQEVSYRLPSSIKQVCITRSCSDLGFEYNCYSPDDNLVFNSSKNNFESTYISNLDIEKILGSKKVYCFDVIDNQVSMTLIKEYNSDKVLVLKIK